MEDRFRDFLIKLGRSDLADYATSIITADSDKCEQYRKMWENAGVPYEHGVMIYLISKSNPYCLEARRKVPVGQWVVDNYPKFKECTA